jgi:TonB family protein
MIRAIKIVLPLAMIASLLALPVLAQEKSESASAPAAPVPAYPNSAEGLRQFLQDCLAAAKSGDKDNLAALVKDMEIPNYEAWFTSTFGQEKGETWAGPYGAELDTNEIAMQEFLKQLSDKYGGIFTRKVNDTPHPNKDMEWGMLDALKRPTDIFFAEWRAADAAENSKGEGIGYFVFIDGKFRWDSTISFVKSQRIHVGGNVIRAKLIRGDLPVYPLEAQANHVEGTVTLHAIIAKDGSIKNLQVLSGDPLLTQAAVDAVAQWRYRPTLLEGRPVEVDTKIDVVFTLVRRAKP